MTTVIPYLLLFRMNRVGKRKLSVYSNHKYQAFQSKINYFQEYRQATVEVLIVGVVIVEVGAAMALVSKK
jgi:hypothetical protein